MRYAILFLMLTSCAQQPRYLTDRQDKALRSLCEKHGCVIVPQKLFDRLKQELEETCT